MYLVHHPYDTLAAGKRNPRAARDRANRLRRPWFFFSGKTMLAYSGVVALFRISSMPLLLGAVLLSAAGLSPVAAKDVYYEVGAAKVDITPDHPIRLNGYGARTTESKGIDQRLYAAALAIGDSKKNPAILVTVDNLAVPAAIRDEVAAYLANAADVRKERFTLCSTHTHTAPMLAGACVNVFGADIPADQQGRIDRYTRELVSKLEAVALSALSNRQPAALSWGRTTAGFAANRRTPGGPVDHDLPILVAKDKAGTLRAVVANYACHCTTLADKPNHICGDWAGYAKEYLEREHPGAVALVTIGCGGDANPQPRTGLEFAKQNGSNFSYAVNQRLREPLTPLKARLDCAEKAFLIPFDTPVARDEWRLRAASTNRWVAYHARKNLARLNRGDVLPTALPYVVQEWNFGKELGMVFLAGEVVVDYSLRLKREFDASRLWVTAYANDVPCYIPSRRVWQEGGYEGGGAMMFYDQPTRLGAGTEEYIVDAVHELLPRSYRASPGR
jgi:hypothetical protein